MMCLVGSVHAVPSVCLFTSLCVPLPSAHAHTHTQSPSPAESTAAPSQCGPGNMPLPCWLLLSYSTVHTSRRTHTHTRAAFRDVASVISCLIWSYGSAHGCKPLRSCHVKDSFMYLFISERVEWQRMWLNVQVTWFVQMSRPVPEVFEPPLRKNKRPPPLFKWCAVCQKSVPSALHCQEQQRRTGNGSLWTRPPLEKELMMPRP